MYKPSEYWQLVNSERKPAPEILSAYREISADHSVPDMRFRWLQAQALRARFHQYGWTRLLEAGCGPGFWFPLFFELALERHVAMDFVDSAIECAHRMAEQLRYEPEITKYPLGPSMPDFSDNEFDVALTVKVMLHVPPPQVVGILRELARIARYVVLIEYEQDDQVQTREHVFNHPYPRLIREAGLGTLEKETLEGLQVLYILSR